MGAAHGFFDYRATIGPGITADAWGSRLLGAAMTVRAALHPWFLVVAGWLPAVPRLSDGRRRPLVVASVAVGLMASGSRHVRAILS